MGIRLLYTESHWAFAVIRVGEWRPVVLDGLRLNDIMQAAVTFCAWLQETYGLANPPSPEWSQSYVQKDGWSCGHRILASWRYLLSTRFVLKPFEKPIAEYIIPQDVLDHPNLQEICSVSFSKVVMKSEASVDVRPKVLVKAEASVDVGPKAEPSAPSRATATDDAKRMKKEVAEMADGAHGALAAVCDDDGGGADDASDQEGDEHDSPGESKREAKRAEKRGKAIADVHEVTNLRWQTAHRSAQIKIVHRHWRSFLQHRGGFRSAEVRNCEPCKAMLALTGNMAAEDIQLPPPRYRSLPKASSDKHRGRPKKGEARDFDWKAWLAAERPQQYEIFQKDVVVKSRKMSTETVEKNALHLRCLLCSGEFRLQRQTNMVALHLHESSKRHANALGAVHMMTPPTHWCSWSLLCVPAQG